MMSAENGNEEVFNDLVKKGADLNAKSNDKLTPLHFAARHGKRTFFLLIPNEIE